MLREFIADFKEYNGEDLANLWTHNAEVQGIEQLMFKGNMAAFTEREGPTFSLVVAGKDSKVLDHTRYLIQCFWSYWRDDGESGDLKIDLYGNAYQAIVPLKPLYDIDNIYSSGTVERVDRFNNSSEKEVRNLRSVVFKSKGVS